MHFDLLFSVPLEPLLSIALIQADLGRPWYYPYFQTASENIKVGEKNTRVLSEEPLPANSDRSSNYREALSLAWFTLFF